MDILSIIIIVLLIVSAVIGAITGVAKGFTNVKSWAVELILTGLIIIPVSHSVLSKLEGSVPAIIAIAATVAAVCIMMFLFMIIRTVFRKRIELRKKLSYYQQYDEMEDNTEKILSAMGSEDKKAFKKLTKRKFKQSGGVWGVLDRIFGMITLAVTGAVITGVIASAVLVILDFTRLAADGGSLSGTFGGIYASSGWAFFKNYIFDFIFIGIISLCIKSGYSSGITSSLWIFLCLGMVAGAGILSFHLAFNVPEFVSAAKSMEENVANALSGISGVLEFLGLTYEKLSQIIIGLIIFIFILIAVILIGVFGPKLIDKARESVIFRSIDGVFGAIALTAVILGVLLVVGALANSLHGYAFMNVFNAYFEKSGIATYIYDKNLLNSMGILTEFPLIGGLLPAN